MFRRKRKRRSYRSSNPRPKQPVRDEVLEGFAKTANDELKQSQKCLVDMLQHAKDCGTALREAKTRIGHGNWLKWLAQNFNGSKRIAQDYMRISREWTPILERETRQNPLMGIDKALKILRLPDYFETNPDPDLVTTPTEEQLKKAKRKKEWGFYAAEVRKMFANDLYRMRTNELIYLFNNWTAIWPPVFNDIRKKCSKSKDEIKSIAREKMIREHEQAANNEEDALDFIQREREKMIKEHEQAINNAEDARDFIRKAKREKAKAKKDRPRESVAAA